MTTAIDLIALETARPEPAVVASDRRATCPDRLAALRRHVEDHADEQLTTEVLARVANVSVRTLQEAFAEKLGESPTAFVRRVRLEKVRAELHATGGHRVHVTDVASRWGFHHASRFAEQYRSQFGELPSETLRA